MSQGAMALAQPQDASIKKILDDWNDRQRGRTSVRAQLEGACVYPRGSISTFSLGPTTKQVFPTETHRCGLNASLLIDFAGRRHAIEYQREWFSYNQEKNTATTFWKKFESRFDGRRIGAMNPVDVDERDQPILTYYTGDFRRMAFDSPLAPFFVAMGTVAIDPDERMMPGNYAASYDPEWFHVHGRGNVDSRLCVVVRSRKVGGTNLVHECWADPARKHLILKHATHMNGKPFSSATIEYQTVGGVEVPKGWEETIYFTDSGKVMYVTTVKCTNIEVCAATSPDLFRFDERPGMVIKHVELQPLESMADRRKKPARDATTFAQVDSGGTPREVTLEAGRPHRTIRSYLTLVNGLSIAFVVVCAVGLIVFALRRRRVRHARSTAVEM